MMWFFLKPALRTLSHCVLVIVTIFGLVVANSDYYWPYGNGEVDYLQCNRTAFHFASKWDLTKHNTTEGKW